MIPSAVVMARDVGDVVKVMDYARRGGAPITFRAAGTSLNGQAQGEGIMVDVRRHWRGVEIEDGGASARVRPGTLLGHVNAVLAPHGRRLGPDPASTDIATVGGVVANNSGGMRCGVVADSYRTVRAMTFALPSGTVIDTAAPDAEAEFAAREPALARGLLEIRDEIRADPELSERIRRKFEIKNTMGYRLVAFLDADTPLEIFRRLIVGSEGTLAFVAEVVFETVPFGSAHLDRVRAVPRDRRGGRVRPAAGRDGRERDGADDGAGDEGRAGVRPDPTGVERRAQRRRRDPRRVPLRRPRGARVARNKAMGVFAGSTLVQPARFTRDPGADRGVWRVREGLHGLLGKIPPRGTSLIIEDVCVPPARIAEAAAEIRALLARSRVPPWGWPARVRGQPALHADARVRRAGRPRPLRGLHGRARRADRGQVRRLAEGRARDRAEHGPRLEREWGAKAMETMWRIRALADPGGASPWGAWPNSDAGVHLRNLKSAPTIEEEADACVECGFCEPVCPSLYSTTTPRQRIVLRREMARQPAGSPCCARSSTSMSTTRSRRARPTGPAGSRARS